MRKRNGVDACPLSGSPNVLIIHVVVAWDRTVLPEKSDPFRALAQRHLIPPTLTLVQSKTFRSTDCFQEYANRKAELNMADQTPIFLAVFVVIGLPEDMY